MGAKEHTMYRAQMHACGLRLAHSKPPQEHIAHMCTIYAHERGPQPRSLISTVAQVCCIMSLSWDVAWLMFEAECQAFGSYPGTLMPPTCSLIVALDAWNCAPKSAR
jgi:hypothetical protein